MKKFKVLITAPYFHKVISDYSNFFENNNIEIVVPEVKERLNENELLEWISDIDGVISGDDQFTESVLKSAPRLKVISKWGTGIDSINTKAAKELGIAVRNTPGAFNEPVGDQVMGFILSFARKIPWINEELHKGNWEKIECISLMNKTIGVIGVGNTGKAVISRAKAFSMRLLGNDIIEMPEKFILSTGIEMTTKEKLLSESDFVIINADLNPTSYHLIGKNELVLMKSSAYLINTARGPLVNEPDLIDALCNEKIAGAALDVFEDEPLSKDSPLCEMSNVLLSPHNANSSPEHWSKIHESTLKNLIDELNKVKKID